MYDWAQATIAIHDNVERFHELIDLLRVVLFVVEKANSQNGLVLLVFSHICVSDEVAHDDDVLAERSLCCLVDHTLLVC